MSCRDVEDKLGARNGVDDKCGDSRKLSNLNQSYVLVRKMGSELRIVTRSCFGQALIGYSEESRRAIQALQMAISPGELT